VLGRGEVEFIEPEGESGVHANQVINQPKRRSVVVPSFSARQVLDGHIAAAHGTALCSSPRRFCLPRLTLRRPGDISR
jgi:hypothetical protein